MELDYFLVLYIKGYTLRHALQLRIRLMRSASRHFSLSERKYARRVYLLQYKTHLGDADVYLNPLFKEVKLKILGKGWRCTDDEIWDMISPVCSTAIMKIKRRIPNHAGKFSFPIPDLLELPTGTTKPVFRNVIMYFRRRA